MLDLSPCPKDKTSYNGNSQFAYKSFEGSQINRLIQVGSLANCELTAKTLHNLALIAAFNKAFKYDSGKLQSLLGPQPTYKQHYNISSNTSLGTFQSYPQFQIILCIDAAPATSLQLQRVDRESQPIQKRPLLSCKAW